MKLPDFLEFESFNKLRKTMGAEKLGEFEFFDPDRHLTGLERAELFNQGLLLTGQQITALNDHTLAFKNSRIVVAIPSPASPAQWCYHIAGCELYHQQEKNQQPRWRAVTQVPQHESGQYRVCEHCLSLLQYRGYDGQRNRHRAYSQKILDEFTLSSFFDDYPVYPVEDRPETIF